MHYFGGIIHDTIHDGLVGTGIGATGFSLAGVIAALIARKKIKAAKGSVIDEALQNAIAGGVGGGLIGNGIGSTIGFTRSVLRDPNKPSVEKV